MEEHADKKLIIDGESLDLVINKPPEASSSEAEESSIFPLARVRKLMLLSSTSGLRTDSVKLISKATVPSIQELFLQDFIQKSYTFTKSKSKKTIVLQDLIDAVSTYENLGFIKDSGILSIEKTTQDAEMV